MVRSTDNAESLYDKEADKVVAGVVTMALAEVGTTDRTGTRVRFMPDDRIFDDIRFNAETIAKRLRELAFLNRGLEIVLVDQRQNDDNNIIPRRVFLYSGGLTDFVEYINENKTVLHPEIIFLEGEKDGIYAQIAIQYTDSYTESIFSYVNNIPTRVGPMKLGLKQL